MTPRHPIDPSIHNRLRDFRQSRGMTQLQLAERLQVTRQTINAIEQERYSPTLSLALRMATFFETTVDQLFYYEQA